MHLGNQIKRWLWSSCGSGCWKQLTWWDCGRCGRHFQFVSTSRLVFDSKFWLARHLRFGGHPKLRSSAHFLAKAQHCGMAPQHRGTAEVMLSRSRFPAQDPRSIREKKHNFHQLSPWREAQCDTKYAKVVHVKGWSESRPIRVFLLFVPKQKMTEVERVYWVYISVCSV